MTRKVYLNPKLFSTSMQEKFTKAKGPVSG